MLRAMAAGDLDGAALASLPGVVFAGSRGGMSAGCVSVSATSLALRVASGGMNDWHGAGRKCNRKGRARR